MPHQLNLEDIETLRRLAGIDDVELHERIRTLAAGDLVNLTLLVGRGSTAGQTVTVRITGVNGKTFQGTLVDYPASRGLSDLRAGAPIAFSAAHIHSVPKGRPARA